VMSARRSDDIARLRASDRRVLQPATGRGGAVPALVGAAAARRDLRALRGARRAGRRRRRVLPVRGDQATLNGLAAGIQVNGRS
jgi:hypothetical protein